MRETMIYDTDVYQIRKDILKRMLEIIDNRKKVSTVFYGDSITKYMDIDHYFSFEAANCGIVGISSDMLLHFVDEAVIKYCPKQVFKMIGTNDLGNTTMTSPRQIAMNVKELIEIIHENLPESKVYLISCIPCIEKIHGYQYKKQGLRSNDILRMVFEEYKRIIPYSYVSFLDVFDSLLDENGVPLENCFLDGLHLTQDGYQRYTDAIKNQLKKCEEDINEIRSRD